MAAGLLVSLLIVEVFIRAWAAAVDARRGEAAPEEEQLVVLCIGDSHTWGRGHGYPERIAELLEQRSDRYHVVNLGVPGTNTAQLRTRLPEQIERYHPELLVVWSGVNNSWNQTAAGVRSGAGHASLWQRLSGASRIVRLYRVWRQNQVLQELFEEYGPYVAPAAEPRSNAGSTTFERSVGDDFDAYVNRTGASLEGKELVAATRDDLVWIVEYARAKDVPVILIAYGLPGGPYGNATFGIRAAAEETGAPLVEASAAAFDLVSDRRSSGEEVPELYDDTVHPTQPLYEAVGDLVLKTAQEFELLPASG